MKMVNPNIPPAGGYVFLESDGTLLKAENWRKLVERVQTYRVSRRLPAGQPLKEIMLQACERSPQTCYESDPVQHIPRGPSIKGNVFQWLGKKSREQRSGHGLDFVADSEADRRAKICKGCPLRVQLGSGCSSCETSLSALRRSVLGGRSIPDPRVGACGVLVVDLVCAIRISEPPVENPSLPANCWRKKV